jgi:hypothetical protein
MTHHNQINKLTTWFLNISDPDPLKIIKPVDTLIELKGAKGFDVISSMSGFRRHFLHVRTSQNRMATLILTSLFCT